LFFNCYTEEADTPAANQHKPITIADPHSDNADSSDNKHQRKHKRKSKRKRSEKAIAPPPLRPRSRPSSQQSVTKSEGTSSGGVTEQGEGLTHAGTPDRKQLPDGNNKSLPDDKEDKQFTSNDDKLTMVTDCAVSADVVNSANDVNLTKHDSATNIVTDTETTAD